MVRTLLLIVLFSISSSVSVSPESEILDGIRYVFGQSPEIECSTELKKFNECVKPYESLVGLFHERMNKTLFYNIELMTEVLKMTRRFSACFGHDVQCKISKAIVFTLDAADFVGSRIYGDAFSCFQDSNIIELEELCSRFDVFDEFSYATPGNDTVRYSIVEKTILKCAARILYPTPSCSIERLVHLYQAIRAGLESSFLVEKFEKVNPVVYNFDASKYCNI
ncbi:unnamed protein product [Caenorhabditis nigoni]